MARRISIRVTGLRAAQTMIGDVGNRARAPEPALRTDRVMSILHMAEHRRFGQRFSPRATRAWAARKRREGLDPRMMRATGALERTLTRGRPPDVAFKAYNSVLSWGLKWRSPVWYAAVHQKRPGRRVVVIDKRAAGQITDIVTAYVATGRLT